MNSRGTRQQFRSCLRLYLFKQAFSHSSIQTVNAVMKRIQERSVIDQNAAGLNCTCGSMDACFTAFDKNCDNNLDLQEFEDLCQALFRNNKDEPYTNSRKNIEDMFAVFDKNSDRKIDRQEFIFCWNNWIKSIVKPISALLLVDVQNDFISGTLDVRKCPAGQNGEEIIAPINSLLDSVQFHVVFYSLDWHPIDHVSFIENVQKRPLHKSTPVSSDKAQVFDIVIFDGDPPMEQKLWPKHCVQNTWGSQLHKDLKVVENGVKIYKGTNPDIDSYSVFWDNMKLTDTKLDAHLKSKNITDLYVCGLAYDFCVGSTAVDSLSGGYRTILIEDCCRGVDFASIERTKESIIKNHGIVIKSSEVHDMVAGKDRRPELGYKLAMELRNKI